MDVHLLRREKQPSSLGWATRFCSLTSIPTSSARWCAKNPSCTFATAESFRRGYYSSVWCRGKKYRFSLRSDSLPSVSYFSTHFYFSVEDTLNVCFHMHTLSKSAQGQLQWHPFCIHTQRSLEWNRVKWEGNKCSRHTVSSTVFLILAPASVTVLPALLTAEAKKLPIDLAPCIALVDTSSSPNRMCVRSTLQKV